MFTRYNLLQAMPISYLRRKILIRFVTFFLFFITYVKSIAFSANNYAADSYAPNLPEGTWKLHPLSIQIATPNIGFITPLRLLNITTNTTANQSLKALGTRIDIGLTYPRKWILKHFDCYPKLGILLKYDYVTGNKIKPKGHIAGGILYIEPNYKLAEGWEILPRIGAGIAYLTIPGVYNPVEIDEEDEEASSLIPQDPESFREGISLNILIDILLKYRLTPNWHLYFGIGMDYLPHFSSKEDEDSDTNDPDTEGRINHSIKMYTISLGGGYTFNPNPYAPTRKLGSQKSSIDIAYLSSFRKADLSKTPSDEEENKYYYIGGLHAQWSYQFFNNQAIVVGSEWVKNYARKKELETSVKKDYLQVSFLLGHEFLWGDLIFGQYAGIYALNNASANASSPFKNLSNLLYLRLGLNYKITNYLGIGTNLKISVFPTSVEKNPPSVEYTRIDYLDFRIVYSF